MGFCKKAKYNSEKSAWVHIGIIQATSNKQIKPINAYLCKWCGTWHLTSKPDWNVIIEKLNQENVALKQEIEKQKEELKAQKELFRKEKQEYINKTKQGIQQQEFVKRLNDRLSESAITIKKLRLEKSNIIAELVQYKQGKK